MDINEYNKLRFKEYDGAPTFAAFGDQFFMTEDEIVDFLMDEEVGEIELIYGSPMGYNTIDLDDLTGGEAHDDFEPSWELLKKIEEFNKYLESLEPHSWELGKVRTKYRIKPTIQ